MSQAFKRGALYLTIANAIFLGSSYIIQVLLGRFLGPAEYGVLGVVIYTLSLTEYFFGSGLFLATSKYIAEKPAATKSIIKISKRIQLSLAIIFAGLFIILANPLAKLFNEPDITNFIRILALIAPIYGFRSLYQSFLNGQQQFGKQAVSMIAGATVKIIGVITVLWIGLGIAGVLFAYLAGGLGGLIFAWYLMERRPEGDEIFPAKKLIVTTLPLIAYLIMFPLIFNIDLFMVKILMADTEAAGYYTAASTIARLPFFLFTSLAVVLLPSISAAIAQQNYEKISYYIRQTLRIGIIIILPLTILIMTTADNLINILYTDAFSPAAWPLTILAAGMFFLTLFKLTTTIIIGGRRPVSIIYYVLSLLIVDIVANILLIPKYGLAGAALASGLMALLGFVITSIIVYAKHRSFIPMSSVLKILFAGATIVLLSYLFPNTITGSISSYILLPIVFFLVLHITKELALSDIKSLLVWRSKPNHEDTTV
ncbi:flippase [Patescibacteria group bacterium]